MIVSKVEKMKVTLDSKNRKKYKRYQEPLTGSITKYYLDY